MLLFGLSTIWMSALTDIFDFFFFTTLDEASFCFINFYTYFFVKPPADAGGFYTVEDATKTVLAHARTLDEIAIAWHGMDDRKRIVEKLVRQSAGSSDQRLNLT